MEASRLKVDGKRLLETARVEQLVCTAGHAGVTTTEVEALAREVLVSRLLIGMVRADRRRAGRGMMKFREERV